MCMYTPNASHHSHPQLATVPETTSTASSRQQPLERLELSSSQNMDPDSESRDGRPSEPAVPKTVVGACAWGGGDSLVHDDGDFIDAGLAPEWDPCDFLIVDDLEEKLKEACAKVGVGPPDFYPLSPVRVGGKVHHGYGVDVSSTPTGVNFGACGGYSSDEHVARQNAAFVAMEVLLLETGSKVWDFNYQVALRYKEQVDDLQQEARLCLPERVFQMEEEVADLKLRLEEEKGRFERARKLGFV